MGGPRVQYLSQEQSFKLRAYETYIKKSNMLIDVDIKDEAAVTARIKNTMPPEWYIEYSQLKQLKAGAMVAEKVQDPNDVNQMLPKKTEAPQQAPVKKDDDLNRASAQLTLLGDIIDNPQNVLLNWDKRNWCLDDEPPQRRYVAPRAKNENDAPVYWNVENDFVRLETAFFLKSDEAVDGTEGVYTSVMQEWQEKHPDRIPNLKDIDDKTYAEDLIKEEPKTLAEEQALIWKCMKLLGTHDYFRTDYIGYEYGKIENEKEWLKEIKDKAIVNGTTDTIKSAKKKIETLSIKITREKNRWAIFRDDEGIKEKEDEIAKLKDKVSKLEGPIIDQQNHIYDLEIEVDKRLELRNKLFDKMVKILDKRAKEVDNLANHSKSPNGEFNPNVHSEGQAYNWLEEQKPGQGGYYRWAVTLSRSLSAMKTHNRIDKAISSISSTLSARNGLEEYMESKIDDFYVNAPSYMVLKNSQARFEKNLNDAMIAINTIKKQMADDEVAYNKSVIDHEIDLEMLLDRIRIEEGSVVETQDKLEGAEEKLRISAKITENINLLISRDKINKMLSEGVGTDVLFYNEYKAMSDEYLNAVNTIDINKLSAPGDDLYYPAGKLNQYVLAEKKLLDTIVAYAKESQKLDQRALPIAIEKLKWECIKFYGENGPLAKIFSEKDNTASTSDVYPNYKEQYNAKATELLKNDSNQQTAELHWDYGTHSMHKGLLDDLKNAKTFDEINHALGALHTESGYYVNRIKIEYDIIKDHHKKIMQGAKRVRKEAIEIQNQLESTKDPKMLKELMPKYQSLMNILSNTSHDLPMAVEQSEITQVFEAAVRDREKLTKLFKKATVLAGAHNNVEYFTNLRNQLSDTEKKLGVVNNLDKLEGKLKELRQKFDSDEEVSGALTEELGKQRKERDMIADDLKYYKEHPNELKVQYNQSIDDFQKVTNAYEKKLIGNKQGLKSFDKAYRDLSLKTEQYRGIVKKETNEMIGKFLDFKAKCEKMNKALGITDDAKLFALLNENGDKIDLDANQHFSGEFRKNTMNSLKSYFENARKVTRKLKTTDSEEYLAMMNAVAVACGRPKLKRDWNSRPTTEEVLEAQNDSLMKGNLYSCLEKLQAILDATDKYLEAKSNEFRPIASEMRVKRLQAANELKNKTQMAINQLVGYPGPNETIGNDGLIYKIDKLNENYNRAISPFGKTDLEHEKIVENADSQNKKDDLMDTPEFKFKNNLPFAKYEALKKSYRKASTAPGAEQNADIPKDEEDIQMEAFFETCVKPKAKAIKAKSPDKPLIGAGHLYQDLIETEESKNYGKKKVEEKKQPTLKHKKIQLQKNIDKNALSKSNKEKQKVN